MMPMKEMNSSGGDFDDDHILERRSREAKENPGTGCDCSGDVKAVIHMCRENIAISWLFIFVPIGIVSKMAGWGALATFGLNFMAIIPLAWILGSATENIAMYTGETLGGLLNATFGNAVEMILGLFALNEGLVRVVQGSLLGSILSNLLLVLGMAFLAGGLRMHEQTFSSAGAGANVSLLLLSTFAMVLPSVFAMSYPGHTNEGLQISHSSAIILALMYVQFLVFQLKTHSDVFESQDENGDDDEEEEVAELTLTGSIVVLLIVTLIVAACSEALVGAIEPLTVQLGIGEGFVGIILLPIVGNAAEHMTAVTMAMKNKMDIAIGVAVGSSTQIALFVTPFTVIAGWMMGVKMTLDFQAFETAVMIMAVLIVGSIVSDGRSNWLEGCILMSAYALTAIAFWYMPDAKEPGAP